MPPKKLPTKLSAKSNNEASSTIQSVKTDTSKKPKGTSMQGSSKIGDSVVVMGSRMSLSNLNATRIVDPVTGQRAFWSRNKKLCCIITGTVGIVFLLAIIFALVALSFVVKPLTTEPPVEQFTVYKPPEFIVTELTQPPYVKDKDQKPPVLSPSDACRYKGPEVSFERSCFYHRNKTLASCETMQCSHLGVLIGLQSHSYPNGLHRVSAAYRTVADNPQWTIKVPDNTACHIGSDPGRCLNGKCVSQKDKGDTGLDSYMAAKTPPSGLEEVPFIDPKRCIILPDAVSPVLEVLTSTECSQGSGVDCRSYVVKMGRCNNPPPAKGEELCFKTDESTGLAKPGQDPVLFTEKCDLQRKHCDPKIFKHVKDAAKVFDSTKCDGGQKYNCGYMMYTAGKERFKIANDDFATCCADYIDGRKGYCLAGNCVAFKQPR